MTETSGTARTFAILDLFLRSTDSLTLSAVSELTGLPRPTAHRYLKDLVSWGGLDKTADGRYRVGPKMWMLGSVSDWERSIRQESRPLVSALAQGLHQAVALTTLHQSKIVCVDRAWGSTPSIYLVQPGEEVPLPPSSAGRILLSGLAEPQLSGAFKELDETCAARVSCNSYTGTPTPVYDSEKLRTMVDEARDKGFSIAAGELRPGQTSLSVLVNVPRMEVNLALSLLTPTCKEVSAVNFLPYLKDAAAVLAKKLGRLSRQ